MDENITEVKSILERIYRETGDDVPVDHEKLSAFAVELMLWNRRFHLTGLKTVEEIVEMGIYSCGRIARYLKKGERVVDIGSGNGLPGLVLAALAPGVDFTLVEKSPTKASFLKTAAAKMGAGNVVVVAESAENLIGSVSFDSAVSMAVFKPLQWLQIGRNFIRKGGRLFLLHSGRLELPERAEGLKLDSNDEYGLPWSGHRRGIAIYKLLHEK